MPYNTYTAATYFSMASDAYKELHGIRPRFLYEAWSALSLEEMEQVYLDLADEVEQAIKAERQAESLSHIASQFDWLSIS